MVTARQLAKWNTRVSMVYALGIWTMLGTFSYFQMKKKQENLETGSESVEAQGACEGKTDDLKSEGTRYWGFHMTQTITYKENFVPYSTRIYNFISPYLNRTSDAAPKNDTSEK